MKDEIAAVLEGRAAWAVVQADCVATMRAMPEASADAVITDPPAGIGFMGKEWDDFRSRSNTNDTGRENVFGRTSEHGPEYGRRDREAFIAFLTAVLSECFRVLKPGGHAVIWAIPRTSGWTHRAIEDAGLEIRDCLTHIFGSGFPKSLDVSKALDKLDAADLRLERARRFQSWLRSVGMTPQRVNELTGTEMGHLTTHPSQPSVPTERVFAPLRPHIGHVPEWVETLIRERTVLESENFKARPIVGEGKMVDTSRSRAGFSGPAFNDGQPTPSKAVPITVPITGVARQWSGWGTALKPAVEFWYLARKPLSEPNVAANVLKHGVGGINVDACRVETAESTERPSGSNQAVYGRDDRRGMIRGSPDGRWPPNFLLSHSPSCLFLGTKQVKSDGHYPAARGSGSQISGLSGHQGQADLEERYTDGEEVEDWRCVPGCPVAALDAQSGELVSGSGPNFVRKTATGYRGNAYGAHSRPEGTPNVVYGDVGGASRFFPRFAWEAADFVPFFYCAKADRAEREIGLEHLPAKPFGYSGGAQSHAEAGEDLGGMNRVVRVRNRHPTVKPIVLMQWLCRLVTPSKTPDGKPGLILDPFAGSGSTVIAALREGFRCVGIEREEEYAIVARARVVGDAPLLNSLAPAQAWEGGNDAERGLSRHGCASGGGVADGQNANHHD